MTWPAVQMRRINSALTAALAALVVALAACAGPDAPITAVTPVASPGPNLVVGLANPAAVACVQAGARVEIERNAAGERGICVFPSGLRCDEWAWFRKEPGACCTSATPPAGSDLKTCR